MVRKVRKVTSEEKWEAVYDSDAPVVEERSWDKKRITARLGKRGSLLKNLVFAINDTSASLATEKQCTAAQKRRSFFESLPRPQLGATNCEAGAQTKFTVHQIRTANSYCKDQNLE